MSTDDAWEEWGKRDPYFGVFTNPKFRKSALTPEAKKEFFDTGQPQVDYVLQTVRQYIDPQFQPRSVLDFGCGVGRVAIPFARVAAHVVGTDVSPSMLDEARINCVEQGITNVELVQSDDTLSTVDRQFDLIHSFIVFQHIPRARGITIFAHMLRKLAINGVGAIHFTYSKDRYAPTNGLPPLYTMLSRMRFIRLKSSGQNAADPEMQMNTYDLNELFFMLQKAGVRRFHTDFTDHGGELGVYLFFQKPA